MIRFFKSNLIYHEVRGLLSILNHIPNTLRLYYGRDGYYLGLVAFCFTIFILKTLLLLGMCAWEEKVVPSLSVSYSLVAHSPKFLGQVKVIHMKWCWCSRWRQRQHGWSSMCTLWYGGCSSSMLKKLQHHDDLDAILFSLGLLQFGEIKLFPLRLLCGLKCICMALKRINAMSQLSIIIICMFCFRRNNRMN